ncbi:MAG: AsnC family transcriptional regulator [Streptosporangiales bacterium]|nr:AsnC family transcriptional regulator [Streptosporangiales bacterium]
MRLDRLDERIVALLLADSRASYARIGAAVGLSAPAVKRRVDKLQAGGVITGYTVAVDPAALGWQTEAFVELYCQGRTSPEQIKKSLVRHPEVVAAYTITGDADALIHMLAADTGHLESALERIRDEPNVVQTKSVIVLSRLLDRATMPSISL